MPRPPRLHVPGGCYHVTLRGNHREALFGSCQDRDELNRMLARALARFDARLHAFCWMTNHLHALIQINERPLGVLVQSVAGTYSRYRHELLETRGHLFERRHGARLVDVEAYFAAVLRYIHLNPIKAGIVRDPRQYPWSSHRAYLGEERIGWLTTELGLSLFSSDRRRAMSEYSRFVSQAEVDEDDIGERVHPSDSRVLGDDALVAGLSDVPSGPPRTDLTLQELAERVCADRGVSVELLCSKSTERRLTPLRLALLEQALERRVANVAEVAAFLGRDPSALSKLRTRHWCRT